jgi:penicillin V acylase-like amidase (Ntn superfamily)
MLHHPKSPTASSTSDLAADAGAVENFIARARLLNAHEANQAAFKKAVETMFTVLSDRRVPYTISIDSKNSKICVSAEVGSCRVSRDISRLGLDDRITAFGQPAHTAKKR